jgi:hypothetical protein
LRSWCWWGIPRPQVLFLWKCLIASREDFDLSTRCTSCNHRPLVLVSLVRWQVFAVSVICYGWMWVVRSSLVGYDGCRSAGCFDGDFNSSSRTVWTCRSAPPLYDAVYAYASLSTRMHWDDPIRYRSLHHCNHPSPSWVLPASSLI